MSSSEPTFKLKPVLFEALSKDYPIVYKDILKRVKDINVLTMARFSIDFLGTLSHAELHFIRPVIALAARDFYNVYMQTMWEALSDEDKQNMIKQVGYDPMSEDE